MVSWRAHPLRDGAPASYAVTASLAGLCVLMRYAFGGWEWAALAAALLFLSLARWFLPTEYRLDDAGVEVRFLGRAARRPWSDFRALYAHRMGVHLSPFVRPQALDPFRGLFLRFAPGRGPEVEAFCRARVT